MERRHLKWIHNVSSFHGRLMKKSKDLRLRIEPELFNEFSRIAQSLDMPVSQIVRRLMSQFIEQNSSERQSSLFPVNTIATSDEMAKLGRVVGE